MQASNNNPAGMIDIHCHPLPRVDDGAETFEVAVEMCKIAAEDGITHLVATPHFNYQYAFEAERNQNKRAELQAAIGEVPKLLLGCDFHISYDNIQRLSTDVKQFTINETQYLLIELDDHFVAQQFDQVLYNLQVAQVVPILTHPERNPVFRRRPELLAKWVARDCLVQVTAQSYLGGFGEQPRRLAERWMQQNLIHFFASDGHDEHHRPPLLSPCYRKLSKEHGEETASRLLVKNPEAVISGQCLPAATEPVDPKKLNGRRWFSFFRS
jgi:protein-tyrosine phosphatase